MEDEKQNHPSHSSPAGTPSGETRAGKTDRREKSESGCEEKLEFDEITACEERYKVLFEESLDAVFVADVETGILIDCNRKAAEIIGRSKEEIIGRHQSTLHPPAEIDGKFSRTYKQHVREKDGQILESQIITKGGEIRDVEIKADLFEVGKKRLVQGIFRDITQRKKMEAELLKGQKLESVGTLAGGIAHAFNNLLTAILGNVSLLKLSSDPSQDQYQRLIDMEKAISRAEQLAQQLLTFSTGGSPVKKPFHLNETIQESVHLSTKGTSVGCELRIPADLLPVDGDHGQIRQVLNNLLSNAIQAMPEGGKIRIEAQNTVVDGSSDLPLDEGRYVRISVQDQGLGIPPNHLPKIFDPFFTTKKTGSGLGLAVAYSVIKNHGGHIDVQSELGGGSTFHFYLPALERESLPKEISPEPSRPNKGKILVMDDEESIRSVSGAILSTFGFQVEMVTEGEAAIASYDKAMNAGQPFDLVILDLTIHNGMGGKEAIAKLREIDPKVRAIVSSGYSNSPVLSDYRSYGFNGMVTKPYRLENFLKTVRGVISGEA